jgi:hypothetical protein
MAANVLVDARVIGLAHACLARMAEIVSMLLTTQTNLRIYRRRGCQAMPRLMPR